MEQQLLQDLGEANPQTPLASFGAEDFIFECAKQKGSQLTTRPTTRPYYKLDISGDKAVEQCNEPSLQKSITALHMGHGPTGHKTYQQVFVAGMLFMILMGL